MHYHHRTDTLIYWFLHLLFPQLLWSSLTPDLPSLTNSLLRTFIVISFFLFSCTSIAFHRTCQRTQGVSSLRDLMLHGSARTAIDPPFLLLYLTLVDRLKMYLYFH